MWLLHEWFPQYPVQIGIRGLDVNTCVTWFPLPTYPDGDPLTVHIDIRGLDVNTLPDKCVVPLYHLQPCRVAVEIDSIHHTMYMLRLEGLDTNPLFL